MRLSTYRDLHKALRHVRLLYEATMHSYHVLYETGRAALRDPTARDKKVEFKLGNEVVRRPLKIVTYHARDVYPKLLRSTLLVRIVAAYEAYLVDAVEEISRRSTKPFMNDGRVEFSQEQLLTIDANEGVFSHIVQLTLRRLTNGGLKEIRKFYQSKLGIDIVADGSDFDVVAEIHDRRHLFVHRSGYADAQYERKYRAMGISEGDLISVSEAYLVSAIDALDRSALHIKKNLEDLFPSQPIRRYVRGNLTLPDQPLHLQYVCFRPLSEDGRVGLSDLSLDIGSGRTLQDIVVWASDNGEEIRLLVGGEAQDMKALHTHLQNFRKKGYLRIIESFKIKR